MKRVLFILFFVPFFLVGQNKDYKNFDKAVKYNAEGNMQKAIKYAKKALEASEDWSQPSLLLASIYTKNKKIDLAAYYLLKVYDEDSADDINGIKQLVKLYFSNGFYSEALFYAEKIVSHDSSQYKIGSEIDMCIKSCRFAINAMKSPVFFNPENLGININTEHEEYLPAISIDGKNLVFSRRFLSNNVLQEDFFISIKDDDGLWGPSEIYQGNLNTPGNEGAFSYSPDKYMVVFTACDRNDRVGRCDLYLLIEGKVYNAGKVINSVDWDTQGCFSPDGKYLYFVSDRDGGYGGTDIWRSEITNKGFLEAENLGEKINTRYDEMSPFLHSDNLTFYFSSNGRIGMGDFDIYISRRGNTLSEWKDPVNIGYPINTCNTENSLVVASDGRTAYYTSDKDGFGLEDIFVFDLPDHVQADEVSSLELDIITQKVGEEVVLKNVVFDSNSSEISKSSFIELENLIAYLLKNPDLYIEIQGHTDDVGSERDNMVLSDKRAAAVYNYLISRVKNSLSYKGYGKSRPLVSNNSEDARRLNRRTSFIIR